MLWLDGTAPIYVKSGIWVQWESKTLWPRGSYSYNWKHICGNKLAMFHIKCDQFLNVTGWLGAHGCEFCRWFWLCCAVLWLETGRFAQILQGYFTSTGANLTKFHGRHTSIFLRWIWAHLTSQTGWIQCLSMPRALSQYKDGISSEFPLYR